jgi:hypothetical protein
VFERQNISIRTEVTEFSSKSTNNCVLRIAGLVSVLKVPCTTFGVWSRAKRAFERRNISIWNEITGNCRPNRRMTVFCDLQGLFRRWKCRALHSTCKRRNISIRNEITVSCCQNPRMIACCAWQGLFRRWSSVHNVRRVKWSEESVWTYKYLK